MPDASPRNRNSGVPAAESAADAQPKVARADGQPDAHYEPDPDQIVKVVHQVSPDRLPPQGPTDFDAHGGPSDTRVTDVAVDPAAPSVWEASPPDEPA